jgi:hypothetical protein
MPLITYKTSLLLCVVYYVVWMYVLPYFGKYTIRQEIIFLDNEGTNTHRLVKIQNLEVAAWDAAHDPSGRTINESTNGAMNGDSEPAKSV